MSTTEKLLLNHITIPQTDKDMKYVVCEAYQHHGYRESDTFGTLTAGQNQTVRGDTPLICVEVKNGRKNNSG